MQQNVSPTSRFQGIARWKATLVVLMTLALVTGSLAFRMQPKVPDEVTQTHVANGAPLVKSAPDMYPDLTLYRTINTRIDKGEGYYAAAADEQRRDGYPVRPFVTMRLPTLAYLHKLLGTTALIGMIWVLMLANLVAWWQRLDGVFVDPGRRVIGIMLVVSGLGLAGRPSLVVLHDNWAGLLISLALALHRPQRWVASLICALLAVSIRELSFPFILLMSAFALYHRRWKELAGWMTASLAFVLILALHAHMVAQVVLPNDPASQGWNTFSGWPFFVLAMRQSTALRGLPEGLGAALVPLAMLGWASWRSTVGLMGLMLISGYAVMMMAIGRPENYYWGLLITPMYLLGLAFVPVAVGDLWASLTAQQERASS